MQCMKTATPAVVTNELGRRYEVLQMTMKKFPSCGCNHAPIEAALQLMKEHKLTPDRIQAVEVGISPYMARLVGAKYDPSVNPLVAAQFSVQYSVASAILRGRLGLAELATDAARDPVVMRLAHAVNVVVDETRDGPGLEGTVVLTTADGKVAKTIYDLPGSPQNPMSAAELAAKAIECFSMGVAPLSATQARALLGRINTIEQLDDVSAFFAGLAGVPASDRRSA